MYNAFRSTGLMIFITASAFAQSTSPKHSELTGWINRVAHSSEAALTAEDLDELKRIRSKIDTEASQVMTEDFKSSQVSLNDYRKSDLIPLNLLKIAKGLEVSDQVAAEDLWHDFIFLRSLKLKSQKQAEGYSAHYLSADALAFRKMISIKKVLEARGLQLPFVQMPNRYTPQH